MSSPATVSRPDARTVLVTRRFDAPPAKVWRAFTEPAIVSRWMLGPPGWTMPVCEMDVRVGGTFRWRWQNTETGVEFGFHGTYLEVDPNRLLRNSEVFDPGTMGGTMGGEAQIAVTLTQVPDGTDVSTRITYATGEDCEAAVSTGMTDGMEISYQGLDRVLAA